MKIPFKVEMICQLLLHDKCCEVFSYILHL